MKMTDIVKDFGDFRAVDHVNFSMCQGEIVAIIGPSGSGKSPLCLLYTSGKGHDPFHEQRKRQDISGTQTDYT